MNVLYLLPVVVVVLAAFSCAKAQSCPDDTICPETYPARVDPGTDAACDTDTAGAIRQEIIDDLQDNLEAISIKINEALEKKYRGVEPETAAISCQDIKETRPDAPSGEYWVLNGDGSPVQVYCEMEALQGCGCGDTEVGWIRIANIDMTDPSQNCPVGVGPDWALNLFKEETRNGKRVCIRTQEQGTSSECNLVFFDTFNIPFTQVCGKVIGYQIGWPDAIAFNRPIYEAYIDGISLTSSPDPDIDGNWWMNRKHIWSFIAQASEMGCNCPCCSSSTGPDIQGFIGDDYFCESGNTAANADTATLYAGDPLWDGMNCGSDETACCNSNQPWFCKSFAAAPNDRFVELRLCADEHPTDEHASFETVEIYVK